MSTRSTPTRFLMSTRSTNHQLRIRPSNHKQTPSQHRVPYGGSGAKGSERARGSREERMLEVSSEEGELARQSDRSIEARALRCAVDRYAMCGALFFQDRCSSERPCGRCKQLGVACTQQEPASSSVADSESEHASHVPSGGSEFTVERRARAEGGCRVVVVVVLAAAAATAATAATAAAAVNVPVAVVSCCCCSCWL